MRINCFDSAVFKKVCITKFVFRNCLFLLPASDVIKPIEQYTNLNWE